MKRDCYVRDKSGRTVGKNVTWTGARKTDHYRTYSGTRTPKERTTEATPHGGSDRQEIPKSGIRDYPQEPGLDRSGGACLGAWPGGFPFLACA
jgi:hypothetical protein